MRELLDKLFIRQTVPVFPPVYFALMMATGIVSIAVYLSGRAGLLSFWQ